MNKGSTRSCPQGGRISPMPVDRDIAYFINSLHSFEKTLGVAPGTLTKFADDDDWSAVIKCHALVDASIAWLLSAVMDERLHDVFSRLNLANRRTGKLAFAEALGLLTKEQMTFLDGLSGIRNYLAHDPKSIGFVFTSHIEALTEERRRQLLNALVSQGSLELRERDLELARKDPKTVMAWAASLLVLAIHGHSAVMDKRRNDHVIQLANHFVRTEGTDDDVKVLAEGIWWGRP